MGDTAAIRAISSDSGAQRAVGFCSDGTLSLWDLEEFEQLSYCSGLSRSSGLLGTALHADFDEQRCLAATAAGTITILDLAQMKAIGSLYSSGSIAFVKADFLSML